jgi:hypothetical protein
MPRANYLGLETRESWVGYRRDVPVYGARYAHRFTPGERLAVTTSAAGAFGGMRADSNAIDLEGLVAVTRRMSGTFERVSLCAESGVELHGVDDGEDGMVSIPLRIGAAYHVPVGVLTLTPYVTRTIARHAYASHDVADGDTRWGWNSYLSYGLDATVGSMVIGAGYRDRDSRFARGSGPAPLAARGSWVLRSGFGF